MFGKVLQQIYVMWHDDMSIFYLSSNSFEHVF